MIGSVSVFAQAVVDQNPPTITCGTPVIGNPSTLMVTIEDTESGLDYIVLSSPVNIGDITSSGFELRPTPLGTTSELFEISRKNENLESSVGVRAVDIAGNAAQATCTIPAPTSVPELSMPVVLIISISLALSILIVKSPKLPQH